MNELHQTPRETARALFKLVEFNHGDRFYEPFRGDGAFYDLMPEPKDWSEIEQGRNFLDYNGQCEHIITNPPYSSKVIKLVDTLNKCFEITTKSINLLLSHKALNFLTPLRLEKFKQTGWNISGIHIINVKQWYGRYFFVQFRQDKPSILTWSSGSDKGEKPSVVLKEMLGGAAGG